ncbi:MAG TPA: hypothetical protein ENJ87_02155 [Gammaproteobacteria bacterium]|nr:hypothetical protein [Gammaproteobacteria bacterium]
MNNKWLILLLTLLCGNAQAFQPSIEIIEQFDDVKLVAFINESDLKDYPLWQPLKEAPPLSIKSAIQAIQDQYAASHDVLIANAVSEIELRKIDRHADYWHYLVKIKSDASNNTKFQVYIVLMSGKVIPALIETESYK